MSWLDGSRIGMVSVVVFIPMRQMFAEVRKMFLHALQLRMFVRAS